jgi:hypothetical protein
MADSAAAEAPMASPQPPMVAQHAVSSDSAPPATASRVDGAAAAVGGGTIAGAAVGSKQKADGDSHRRAGAAARSGPGWTGRRRTLHSAGPPDCQDAPDPQTTSEETGDKSSGVEEGCLA